MACVYIDVNGLHDLNNKKGHAAGDEMLQFIASQIIECFGKDLTYRYGGDEFIAFCPDMDREELIETIDYLVKEVEAKDYSIAVGYEIAQSRLQSINDLVKQADKRMQDNKRLSHKERQ